MVPSCAIMACVFLKKERGNDCELKSFRLKASVLYLVRNHTCNGDMESVLHALFLIFPIQIVVPNGFSSLVK